MTATVYPAHDGLPGLCDVHCPDGSWLYDLGMGQVKDLARRGWRLVSCTGHVIT